MGQDVIVIGGGLSGLTIAWQLKKRGLAVKVLEAQHRLGGRIETIYGEQHTPMEMGATWFNAAHKNLLALLAELNIVHFEQHTEGIALFDQCLLNHRSNILCLPTARLLLG